MTRRFVVASMAAAIAAGWAAPMVTVAPASAAVLFGCSSVPSGAAVLSPGLGHTPTAQNVSASFSIGGCSNGQTGSVLVGSANGLSAVTTYAARPLGCPTYLGGAGPDYADQTPVLIGGNPSFSVDWAAGADSTGVAKVKSRGTAPPARGRIVFSITAGQYAPPAGQKTKIKGTLQFTPFDSFDCTGDFNRIEVVTLSLESGGSLIVQQQ
jgi:hypothetical protein